MLTDEELELLKAVHEDPAAVGPLLAYSQWLAAHGDAERAEIIRLAAPDDMLIHREVMRLGLYVGQGPCEEQDRRTRIGALIHQNYAAWTEGLPQGICRHLAFDGYCTLQGLPLVDAKYCPGLSAETLNERCREVSPHLLLELVIAAYPATAEEGDRRRWWGGSMADIALAVGRASRLRLLFREPNALTPKRQSFTLGPPLRIKPAVQIIEELAEIIDTRRTPWITIDCASKTVRNAAESLIGSRGGVLTWD